MAPKGPLRGFLLLRRTADHRFRQRRVSGYIIPEYDFKLADVMPWINEAEGNSLRGDQLLGPDMAGLVDEFADLLLAWSKQSNPRAPGWSEIRACAGAWRSILGEGDEGAVVAEADDAEHPVAVDVGEDADVDIHAPALGVAESSRTRVGWLWNDDVPGGGDDHPDLPPKSDDVGQRVAVDVADEARVPVDAPGLRRPGSRRRPAWACCSRWRGPATAGCPCRRSRRCPAAVAATSPSTRRCLSTRQPWRSRSSRPTSLASPKRSSPARATKTPRRRRSRRCRPGRRPSTRGTKRGDDRRASP